MAESHRKNEKSSLLAKRASLFLATILSLSGIKLFCGGSALVSDDVSTTEYTLPEGDDPVEMFLSSLSSEDGVYGSLSFGYAYPDTDGATESEFLLSASSFGYVLNNDEKAFHIEGTLTYNDVFKPFLFHYGDGTAYVSLLGARYSYASSDFDEAFESLTDIFGTDFVTIPDSFYEALDSLLGVSDEDEDEASSIFDGFSFLLEETTESSFLFSMSLPSPFVGTIDFLTDASYLIQSIESNGLSYDGNDISLSFVKDSSVSSPSAAISSSAPSDSSSYTPIVDSMGLVERIVDLAENPAGLLKIEADIDNETSFPGLDKEAQQESFDLSGELAFDWNDKRFWGEFVGGGYDLDDNRGTKSVSFHNSYADDGSWEAYLDYNEIMKISLDETAFDSFIALFEDEAGSEGISEAVVSALEDTAIVKDANNGRYEKILDAIQTLESGEDTLHAVISLKNLGLGDSSLLDLTLKGENKGLSQAIFTDLEVGTAVFNTLSITLDDYIEKAFDEGDYFAYEGLPTLASQVQSLFDEQRAHVSFTASIVDADGLGYPEIYGETYFDLKQKTGTAEVNLINKISDDISKNNHVVLDVTGGEDTDVVKFHYNDGDSLNDGMKGQMAIKDLNSIIELAVGLYNNDDPRFAKFFDPIRLALASNAIGALSSNRFGPFIATKVVTSADLTADKWTFAMDGNAFGMDEDSAFEVSLGFVSDELSTIAISGISMDGNTIDAMLTLEGTSFEDSSLTAVDLGDDYFQFDGIDALLEAALNEANRETFHIHSDSFGLTLSVIGISAVTLDLSLDFSIYVKDEVVKVYGIVSYDDYPGFGLSRYVSTTDITKNETLTSYIYYDNVDPDLTEQSGVETAYADQKGYLYVSQQYSYQKLVWFSYKTYEGTNAVKYSTDQLADVETVINLIFYDILGIDIQSYYDSILSSDAAAIAYENMLTEYEYANSDVPAWTIGVDFGVLANTSVLNEVVLTIAGTGDDYIASLTADDQKILSIASLVTATLDGTIYNDPVGTDYWDGDASDAWEQYLVTDGHRSDDCSVYSAS